MRLHDTELNVMNILWNEGDTTAKRLAEILKENPGWSKTTTYTIIKICLDKGLISREEPNFVCHALVTKKEIREREISTLINRFYDGIGDKQLVASLLGQKKLSKKEIEKLKKLVEELD